MLIYKILNFIPAEIDKEENCLIDACFGEGGYTEVFLKEFCKISILGIEQDKEIYEISKEKFKNVNRLFLVNGNFKDIDQHAKIEEIKNKKIKFIVFDLGISMFHIKASNKGISFNSDVTLDMRMSDNCSESAYDIINKYNKNDLANLFYYYADETMSRQIADAIVSYRKNKKIETNGELVKIISCVKKDKHKNPATKVFQALRIKVNNEYENLSLGLEKSISIIDKGVKVAIVSYHSGEDRIVKEFIKSNKEKVSPVNKKPIVPDYEEIKSNPSSRSAKLRIFEKF